MNRRFLYLVERNFLVWRKLLVPSLLANLADPLIYLLGLGFGVGALIGNIDGRPYSTFLAGGMLCYSTLNSASAEALYSAFSRLKVQRTWEGILHAPMTITDVVVGEWLWAAAKATLSGSASASARWSATSTAVRTAPSWPAACSATRRSTVPRPRRSTRRSRASRCSAPGKGSCTRR
jgi:lipooligosaccharide transport system permease protein